MRLARLDLVRYGKFTDFSINFGPVEAGQPDLHIIYGPNEAGKSTSFAAYLDLLFGIGHANKYNFLHPYETMKVGARLEFPAGTRELIRLKRQKNSLLDPRGEPQAESIALAELGTIDREAYRTMFSLDEDSLQAGGENILASKGELGQLLFSATAGLAGISGTLALLREETERIYKYRGHKNEIAELKKRLVELKQQRDGVDTLAHQFARLIEIRDGAQTRYERAREGRAELQARRDRVQRLLQALPLLAELARIDREREALPDLRQAPDHWGKLLPQLQKEGIALQAKQQAQQAETDQLRASIGAIAVDRRALALADRMEHFDRLRGRYLEAEEELPEARLRCASLDRQLLLLCQKLRSPARSQEGLDAAGLVLDAPSAARLRRLMERHSGVNEALASARREAAAAEAHLEEARAGLPPGTEGEREESAALTALAGVLATVRASDHEARQRLADSSIDEYRLILRERIAALLPWQGDAESLRRLPVPAAAMLERIKAELAECARRMVSLEEKMRERRTERLKLSAELQAISRMPGVAGDPEASDLRARRNAAWSEHRNRLDAASAERFEALMRQDDAASDARLAHAGEHAQMSALARRLAVLEAEEADQLRQLETLEELQRQLEQKIGAHLAVISGDFAEDVDLHVLSEWCAAREAALEAARQLEKAQSERDLAGHDGERLRERLARAVIAVASDIDSSRTGAVQRMEPEMLTALAQSMIDRAKENRMLAHAFTEAERQARSRRKDLLAAEKEAGEWRKEWESALSSTWLAELDPLPDVAAMRDILDVIEQIEPVLLQKEQLAGSIRRMEKERCRFEQEVLTLAQALRLPEHGEALQLFRTCREHIEEARTSAGRLQELQEKLDAQEEQLKETLAHVAVISGQSEAMLSHFSVRSLEDVAERLRLLERGRELQERREQLVRDIMECLVVPTMEEAHALSRTANREALQREQAGIVEELERLDQEVNEHFAAWRRAGEEVEAVGADDAVARLELQRRVVQMEIEEKARRYLRLRAGIAAAERALRTYRDRHRSAMMERASEAFRMISRGSYSGLTTQPEKEQEVLIATAANGSTKNAAELSRGTRFQLYLALRVAGYMEFARSRQPVPFVADDIMETFDEMRSAETFRVFEDMARVGQVIYLTHHWHLVEMARDICPAARIHLLPDALAERAA